MHERVFFLQSDISFFIILTVDSPFGLGALVVLGKQYGVASVAETSIQTTNIRKA